MNQKTTNRKTAKEQEIVYVWECNECGSQEYTMSVSEDDVNNLGCGDCGANEWHKAEQIR